MCVQYQKGKRLLFCLFPNKFNNKKEQREITHTHTLTTFLATFNSGLNENIIHKTQNKK